MFPIQRLTKLPWAGGGTRSSQIPNHCPGNWQPVKPIASPARSYERHASMPHQGNPKICALGWAPHSQTASYVNFIPYLYMRVYIQSPSYTDKIERRQSIYRTDMNLCRITRSQYATKNYEIIICIGPVIIL